MVGNLKTAGSTIDSMQNPWANVKGLKPLLMYKRIAMHTTSNNVEMMRGDAELAQAVGDQYATIRFPPPFIMTA